MPAEKWFRSVKGGRRVDIEVERGSVSKIMLNRPAVRNALDAATIQSLIGAFSRLGNDPEVRVIILSATGHKAFCAGADLHEVSTLQDASAMRAYFSLMANLIETIRQTRVPVIAATFGFTLAGGMGLAAAADFVIAADDGHFGLPEVKIGLFPMVGMASISRLIGPRRTLELALTGRIMTVQELNAWGFFNDVVPSDQVQERARDLADSISQGSPFIVQLGKEAWLHVQDLEYHKAVDYLKNMVTLVALSPDSREGIQAFQEKRTPQWPSAHRQPEDM
jgi:enoyl-CoA hydratase/carnithine racemase